MSSTPLPASLLNKIEDLCKQGCQHVNNVIQKLEQNQTVEELKGLSDEEKQQILINLNDIMSVYNDKNDE